LLREGERDTLNELVEREVDNKGNKKNAQTELEKFIDDIKAEKIESEENQYLLQLAEERLTERQQSKSK